MDLSQFTHSDFTEVLYSTGTPFTWCTPLKISRAFQRKAKAVD